MKTGIHLTLVEYTDASRMAELLNDIDLYNNTNSISHPYLLADANAFISAVVEYEKENNVQERLGYS